MLKQNKSLSYAFHPQSDYKKRITKGLFLVFVISVLFLIIIINISNWGYGFFFFLFFFIIQAVKIFRREKYFITEFTLTDSRIYLRYFEESEVKTATMDLFEIKVKKGIAFNKTKTAYLEFLNKDRNVILRQYEDNIWKEPYFDKIVTGVNKIKEAKK